MKYIFNEISTDGVYVAWDSKFEIGLPQIDIQHKKLVELCNNLYHQIMIHKEKNDWKNDCVMALKECVAYVQTHFADEEKLMIASNYESYTNHKAIHTAFAKKVLEFSQSFETLSITQALQFSKFLYDWIFSHIAHEDKLYVPRVVEYLKAQKN